MRYCKTDGDYITNYYYDSQNNLIGLDKAGSTLFFYYDSNGTPTSFKNNGTMYYYIRNLQGDIVKIVKQDGTVVASYTYDAWGKILTIKDGSNVDVPSSNAFHVANLNPYRYRGYIYDNETGFYYLQTRYYDPITGRFLNADDTQYVLNFNPLSCNLYTYCFNNSINYVDEYGTMGYYQILMPYYPIPLGPQYLESLKAMYAVSATIVLDTMGYLISKKLFLHSLYYEGTDIGTPLKHLIAQTARMYEGFMDTVYKNVRNNVLAFSFSFNEGDLYYSLHSVLVSCQRMEDKYGKYIRVRIVDTYDFTVWENFDSLGHTANNFAVVAANLDLLQEYKIQVEFTYYYYYFKK